MAEKKIFTILDIKTELHSPPFFMNSRGEAVRAFKDLANDQNTTVGKHPADFKLVYIGIWEEEKGMFVNDPHESLGFAVDYVALGGVVPLSVKKEA